MTKNDRPGSRPDEHDKSSETKDPAEAEQVGDEEIIDPVEIIDEGFENDPGNETNPGVPGKEELLDSLLRLKADFENYRKRMVKEQTRILETAEADLIRKLLPVIDNLQRALDHADRKSEGGLYEGVQMVLTQMLETLGREGLEEIDPEGEPFDPEHHEAMMVVETDNCPEDQVVEVVQKGYRFRNLLIRPAMVKVSCALKS
ncbi:MAG: nucleotide exchange factor GrpE [Actinobacteria bacterium]|nr:nucleotide exchange factor GrpE [Actinomycetota bacterium]